MGPWVTPLIEAGSGILSSLTGGLFGKSNSSKSLRFQQEENQKNREHNLMLAKMQNKWNMEMYDKNNQYNSPAEQRRRLAAAGVNPDLFYGGSGSLTPAVAPNLTAGEGSHSSVNPAIAPYDAAGVVSSGFDNALKAAQVGLIKAQTKKVDAEGDVAISDAKIRDELNNGTLELQGAQIKLTGSQVHLNEEQARKIQPEIENINATTSYINDNAALLRGQLQSVEQDVIYKKIQNVYADKTFQHQIKVLASQANLNNVQARSIVTKLFYEIANLKADERLKLSQANLNDKNAVNVQFQNDELQVTWDARTSSPNYFKFAKSTQAIVEPIKYVMDAFGSLFH
ncbi:DNA pilot protein [Dipodfec virus UOA04_Rod_524]|nr:DNA pilot protein [Dipodfec virus UOA04_Rod_524]